jgi:hypothetical protein
VSLTQIVGGTYDPASNSLSGLHLRYLFYVKDGRGWRTDLLRGNSHAPVQVSGLTDLCRVDNELIDFNDALNSGFEVSRVGPDAACNTADDTLAYIHLNATSSDSGFARTGRTLDSLFAADGSVAYVFSHDADDWLRRYDANFANPAPLFQVASGTEVNALQQQDAMNLYLTFQASGSSVRTLGRYSVLNHSFLPIRTFASASTANGYGVADDAYLYFQDEQAVRRVAHDSGTSEVLAILPANLEFVHMDQTTNRLVIETYDTTSSEYALWSMPKAVTSALTPIEGGHLDFFYVTATAGTRIYYTLNAFTGQPAAAQASEDGSGAMSIPLADWGGYGASPVLNAGGLNRETVFRTLVLGQSDQNGLVTLNAVDAASGATGITLGTIDQATQAFGVTYDRYLLSDVTIYRPATNTFDTDVYFSDLQTPGSLQPVAATVGQDDTAYFFF